MKRSIRNFIFATLIVLGLLASFSSVFAEEERNDVLEIYNNQSKITRGQTESKTGDNLKSESTFLVSRLVNLMSILVGASSLTSPSILIENGVPKELHYGLLQQSTGAMMNAFMQPPSANIPQYYSEMLLPDQFKPSGSTAYAALSNPPDSESSSKYLGYMGVNKLWGISFSIAMSAVVVLLMIAGFMVMFRSKIGGQTTVTVMMALQNIILGSILALASYALGSFFLNLSKYLIMMLAFFFASNLGSDGFNVVYLGGPLGLIGEFLKTTVWGQPLGLWSDYINAVKEGYEQGVNTAIYTYGGFVEPEWFGSIRGFFSGTWNAAKTAARSVSVELIEQSTMGLVAKLIMSFAMLTAILKIFWAIVQTYIKMVIDIILAPVVLVFSSLPGKQSGFSNWLKRMFRNSIAVPIMFAFINVAAYMAIAITFSESGCNGALLTCISGGAIPAASVVGTDWLLNVIGPGSIVTLVLLNMIPAVPKMLEEMLAGKGDFGKSTDIVSKNLQSIPGVGGLFK